MNLVILAFFAFLAIVSITIEIKRNRKRKEEKESEKYYKDFVVNPLNPLADDYEQFLHDVSKKP